MQQIERGIYFEDGYLGVTLGGLVFSHGTIIIDSPLRAEDARSWRSSLLNQRGGANRLLVNLDSHPDRTLGDRALDCTIVAHQKAAQVFRNRPSIFKGHSLETGAAWETYPDAIGMRWAIPDITFSERMSLHWGGPEVLLEHHPGPSAGAIWIVIPDEKVVFVGDAVTLNQPPFLANGDLPAWIESLELLASYDDFLIISGRGGLVKIEAVQSQLDWLRKAADDLEHLSERNVPAEATEEFVVKFLSQISHPRQFQEQYAQRLRYGLFQYFNRRYRSVSTLETIEEEDDE